MKKETKEESTCPANCLDKAKVREFLKNKMPAMFDRTPEITGHLDSFVEELIANCK